MTRPLAALLVTMMLTTAAVRGNPPADININAFLDRFVIAFDNLDWPTFTAMFEDDATVFYPSPPNTATRATGRHEYEAAWRRVFEGIRGARTTPPFMDLRRDPQNILRGCPQGNRRSPRRTEKESLPEKTTGPGRAVVGRPGELRVRDVAGPEIEDAVHRQDPAGFGASRAIASTLHRWCAQVDSAEVVGAAHDRVGWGPVDAVDHGALRVRCWASMGAAGGAIDQGVHQRAG
jgi:hypothetical protein